MLLPRISYSPLTDEAFAAVWDADNDRALALLHNVDAQGCASMRARIWMRLKCFDRVIAEFERRELHSYVPHEASSIACSAAFAHAVLGQEPEAQRALEDVRSATTRSNDPLLKIQHAYASARVDLVAGNLERSRQTLGEASSAAAAGRNLEARTAYQWELDHLRARILELEGRHLGLGGDHEGQEACYVSALLIAERTRHRDRWFEANLLAMLGELLAMYPSHRSRHYVLSRSVPFAWNSHLDSAASLVKRGLRNNRRLFGFDERVETIGGRSAPSLAGRLGERIDALALDEWQNREQFIEEMRFAVSIALDVDWTMSSQHEAQQLARLGVLLTPYEPALARTMWARYRTRLQQLPVVPAILEEPKRVMLEVFLEGCLLKAEGDLPGAAESLRAVHDFWRSRGLGWLSAVAGIERFGISRDSSDLAAAREYLAAHPTTTFARRLGRALDRAPSLDRTEFAYLGIYGAA
jgi:hypothetical protein